MAGAKKPPAPFILNKGKQKGSGKRLKKMPELIHTSTQQGTSLWFEDEGSFGRISKLSRCWVPPGGRALVGRQVIREHLYCFSAVCPDSGETYSLLFPHCNSEAMNLWLSGLNKHCAGQSILIVTDRAGWHQSKELVVPSNIQLELLPPYSPDLNPCEHLWDYIREQKGVNNHNFKSLDDLEEHLVEVLQQLHQEKPYIQSLCSFRWMFPP
jgi:hypothetical protein